VQPARIADWEPRQVRLGRALVERARRIGRRSQVDNAWVPGDPELLFGLHAAGER
jgi:2,6-dihydroxypyridine 3-monooxygenase